MDHLPPSFWHGTCRPSCPSKGRFALCRGRTCGCRSQSSVVWRGVELDSQDGKDEHFSVWPWTTLMIHLLCGNQSPELARRLFQCRHSFCGARWHFQTPYSFISWSLCSVIPRKGMVAGPGFITGCMASSPVSQTGLSCRQQGGRSPCAAFLLQILCHRNVDVRASSALPLIKPRHMELLK